MEGEVGVGSDPVGGGVLPGLHPRPVQQVVELQGHEEQLALNAGRVQGSAAHALVPSS